MGWKFDCDPKNIFFRCVEDSNEAIMISDRKGVLVYVNPAWRKIYGYTTAEAIGATPRLLHSGLQPDSFYRDMWAQIQDPLVGHWKGELVNRAKDGTLVPVLLTITPFKSAAGDDAGYMGIAVDVTYRKELEAKVAHQDRLASVGILASGLAHEIGTPLGVIRGRAEFLGMRTEDPHLKKGLDVITSEIDRISKLIRSLLRVSRSYSDVHMEDVSPANVAREVFSLVGQHFRDHQVEVRLLIPDELKVRADFGRLEQVFLNLVMNAAHALRKAKDSGQTGERFVALSSQIRPNGKVELRVEDSGCGIPPENMKKLFKPFFTTKDVGEGTGLGLAIVAQLVREMEGEVDVQSAPARGTVFIVTLAAASP